MTQGEQIKEAIKAIGGEIQANVLLAKVTATDEDNATISADIGNGIVIEDIRLRSVVDGGMGLVVFPAIDSLVQLLRLGTGDDFQVIGYGAADKVVFTGENSQFEVNQEGIIFNGAALGSYMADINNLVGKINALENDLNSLKTVFSTTFVPVPSDGGAALKAFAATWAAQTFTPTQVDDLKDGKVQN